jgi:hypothetical protein
LRFASRLSFILLDAWRERVNIFNCDMYKSPYNSLNFDQNSSPNKKLLSDIFSFMQNAKKEVFSDRPVLCANTKFLSRYYADS